MAQAEASQDVQPTHPTWTNQDGHADNVQPLLDSVALNAENLKRVSSEEARAFMVSILMTIASEIGDKTFFIAVIMAMRHSRWVIFSASLLSLAVMTVLSALMGHVLPHLLPLSYVELAAALLFFVFGGKMLNEGWSMDADHARKELEETNAELDSGRKTEEAIELEAGEFAIGGGQDSPLHPRNGAVGRTHSTKAEDEYNSKAKPSTSFRTLLETVVSPVFVQTAVIMFLAEWGDRSQLATIALAAAQDMFWVSLGTILGHALCTGLAVLGGHFLATQISVRSVTLSGGVLFLVFGLLYFYQGLMSAMNMPTH
ncbi:GCR1-dependent translation factor 1 [Dispira parvispora]|uniref:GDT1 family protein n=1 Tax=Dispira parvispora TaxID=1520584 RepID=A0A9W8AQZ9_9FUNG|nr:GCR1-dependent translation factor 1 [Dispira parvispora]